MAMKRRGGGSVAPGRRFDAHRRRATSQKRRVQIVGQIPAELSRRARAEAKRRKVSLNTVLIEALTQAVSGARRTGTQEVPR